MKKDRLKTKLLFSSLITIAILVIAVFLPSSSASASASGVSVTYGVHVQTYGDQKDVTSTANNIMTAGTSGEAKRLERIHITLNNPNNEDVHIQYRVHVQSIGWMPWCSDGENAGTAGFGKRLEGIQIQLKGADAGKYSVYYRVHAQSVGWMNWACDGQEAGTAGGAKRLEGIQIVVLPKGEYPASTTPSNKTVDRYVNYSGAITPYSDPNVPHIVYEGHVQSYGDQLPAFDGRICGTASKGKRVESFKITLTNESACGYANSGVEYRTHVQSYGDRPWVKDGEMSGTKGEAKRVESIYIKLYGPVANDYSVYYMSHAQGYGDLPYVRDGAMSGTSGEAKRLEFVTIALEKKSGGSSGNTGSTGGNTGNTGTKCSHSNLELKEEVVVTNPNPDPVLIRNEGWDSASLDDKYNRGITRENYVYDFTYFGCYKCYTQMYNIDKITEWTNDKKQAHIKECGGEIWTDKGCVKDNRWENGDYAGGMDDVMYYDICSKCGIDMIDGFVCVDVRWSHNEMYKHSDACGQGFKTFGDLTLYRWHPTEYSNPEPETTTIYYFRCTSCGETHEHRYMFYE